MTNPDNNSKQPPFVSASANPTPAKRRPGLSCSLPTLIATAVVFVVLVIIFNFVTGEKPIPDYPGATKAELTSQGNQFIDSLYQNNKRESSSVKVFLTSDSPQQILAYYNTEFDKLGYKQGERAAKQSPGTISILFSKENQLYALITSDTNDGRIKDQPAGQSYIIVAQGRT